jgi:DNA-binding MarR family transcriptional regulator
MMAGVLVASITSGQLISRFGRYKPFPVAGTALMVVGLALLSRLRVGTPTPVVGAYMLVLGLGVGLVLQVLVLAAQNAVDYKYLGVASSGSTLFRQIGGSSRGRRLSAAGFLTAAGVAAVGFGLTWLLREVPLRTTTQAPDVGDGFHPARDGAGLRELERSLSLLATREHRWELYTSLADRAALDLPPPELCVLARLGERPPLTGPQLSDQLYVDPNRMADTLAQLRGRSLVRSDTDGTIELTSTGRAGYERLVAARRAGLRELLDGWQPDQHREIEELVDRLARDLVREMPVPA